MCPLDLLYWTQNWMVALLMSSVWIQLSSDVKAVTAGTDPCKRRRIPGSNGVSYCRRHWHDKSVHIMIGVFNIGMDLLSVRPLKSRSLIFKILIFTTCWTKPVASTQRSVITDEGSKPEILSRIAQTTAALTRLKPVWIDKSISLSSKIRLMRSLVTSIFLYACESWTLTAELQRRIQAMEMRCYRKILHISYKDHVTNEEVRAKIQQAIGPHEDLLTIVKRRKLQWYGHVSRSSGLAKTILQGTVKGGRRQGRQRKRWEDNIREWTGLEFGKSQRAVENREKWRKLVAKSSVVPQRPQQDQLVWSWQLCERDIILLQNRRMIKNSKSVP